MTATRVVIDVDNVLWWFPPRNVATLTDLLRAIRERFGAGVDVRLVATDVSASDTAALRDAAVKADAHLTLVPRRGSPSVEDALAAQAMEGVSNGLERLVFASIDLIFSAVITALKRTHVYTVALAPPDRVPVAVRLAADELIDVTELTYVAQGLISPGDDTRAIRAIREQFARAGRQVAVIDRYVGARTIRLLQFVPPTVEVVVIGSKIDAAARDEARALRGSGRRIRVISVADVAMPHDRWFQVDGEWWHSGASLKDIGHRFSRISRIDDKDEIAAHDAMLLELLRIGADA